jgi:hypothetical protein
MATPQGCKPARSHHRDGQRVLHDLRFRTLLGGPAWSLLPQAVRERFSKRLVGAAAVTYAGEIVESRMSRLGWLLAQLGRIIGSPLPLHRDISVPAIVTVTEDEATGGQFWTRIYGRAGGFPQIVQSSKRFTGPTGLEEYLGYGIGIALAVTADETALSFRSDHYFFSAGRVRMRLPRILEPGDLTIRHVDRGDGSFAFVLKLHHTLFGEMISQTGLFREQGAGGMPWGSRF